MANVLAMRNAPTTNDSAANNNKKAVKKRSRDWAPA